MFGENAVRASQKVSAGAEKVREKQNGFCPDLGAVALCRKWR
jgi:hypothetical protein